MAATRSRSPSGRSSRCAKRTRSSRTGCGELIRFGGENDKIAEKLHRSTLALFAAPDLETTLAVLYHSLREDFGVPQVASRLWGRVPEQSYLPELAATTLELREYADQIGAPYCGPQAPFEARDWFEARRRMASRSRSCRCAPRTRSAFSVLRARIPSASIAGMGTVLSHATGGARERRHRALPSARLRSGSRAR